MVRDGVHRLGFGGVESVRVGKHIELTLEAADEIAAQAAVESMCEKLLRNPVIEDSRVTIREVAAAAS